ncbi:hypothetical protein [Halegenticoccus tardaugens]|nr:hypothetical protein [Halegenticoccus tardaugens]
MANDDTAIPFWWIVLFLLLALGFGVATLYAVGGSIIDPTAVALPVSLH